MYFVVIAHGKESLDLTDEKFADAAVKSHRYREPLVEDGTILFHGHIVGNKGHIWVYDVQSADELDRIMTADPSYPWIENEPAIYMVISEQRALQLERQFFPDKFDE